jgi:tetratricopeptide (TPR) repeat protein
MSLRARPSIAPRASGFVLLLALCVPARATLAWGGNGVPAAPPATPAPPTPASAPVVAPSSVPPPGPAATAGAPDVEGPMHPEAAALYKRGLERFGARDYAAAVADLEAGYAIEPRREFLFAEGQAKRLAGDCKGAVALYQRFLATNPSPVQANATQIALGRCAQHLAAHPEVVVVQTPQQPLPPPPPPPPWWRDPVGVGFTGAGVVGIGVGVGFIAASYAAQHDAQSTSNYDPYDQRWSTAESRWGVGVGTLALGTALTAIGVTRFVLLRREHAREAAAPPAVSIGPGRLQLGGAF